MLYDEHETAKNDQIVGRFVSLMKEARSLTNERNNMEKKS